MALHTSLLRELDSSSSSVRRMVQRTIRARLLPTTLANTGGLGDDAAVQKALTVLESDGDDGYSRLLNAGMEARAAASTAGVGTGRGGMVDGTRTRVRGFEEGGDCLPLQVCSDDAYVYVTST